MPEHFYDGSQQAEVVQSQAADEAESLAIANQLEQGEAPAKLAGKYDNPEQLEKAYLELQQKLGGQQQQQTAPTPEVKEPTVGDALDDAYRAFTNNEGLKPEDLKAFENVSKEDLIKAFFEKSTQGNDPDLSDQQLNEVFGRVGGEESYKQMMQWAANTLSPQEVEQFDSIIDGGNMQQIGFAVDAVAKRYADATGVDGNLLQGKGAPRAEGFRSQAELIRAMEDPRYEQDEAYRGDVARKLANSPNVKFG